MAKQTNLSILQHSGINPTFQSVANIRIYSNIRIFLAEYLIFEYEYIKIGIRIYSNIRTNEKLGYEYIRIFVNFLQIYSSFIHLKKVDIKVIKFQNKRMIQLKKR